MPHHPPSSADTQFTNGRGAQVNHLGFELPDHDWLKRVRKAVSNAAPCSVGDYEILKEIGRGGQGIVYQARQPNTGRLVALKRVSAGVFATEVMRQRFEREVEAAAALDHPNIVTVYGSESIDGQSVLVMQWVDGVPIDRWAREKTRHEGTEARRHKGEDGESVERCREGEAPAESRQNMAVQSGGHATGRNIREILELFVQVCDAIQHAHQRGIIHRDIKPSNILVDMDDRPHVLDFGLAKLHQDSNVEAALTETGAFVGTPAYSSPEQLRGELRTIDVRTDVYSIGAVLYQALTGRTILSPSIPFGMLVKALEALSPVRPSKLNVSCNREVDAIVLKAIHPDREQRYSSIETLRVDIQRLLGGETVLAHPPSTTYRVRKFLRRHTASSLLAAVALAALITLGVVSTVQAARDRALRHDAEEQTRLATLESDAQRETAQFLMDFLSRVNRHIPGRMQIRTRDMAGFMDAAMSDADLRAKPEVRMKLHHEVGRVFDAADKTEMALKHEKLALELGLSLYGEDDFRLFEVHMDLANALRRRGALPEAEAHARSALALADHPRAPNLHAAAEASNRLSRIQQSRRDWRGAELSLRRAAALCAQDGTNVDRWVSQYLCLANLYSEQHRLQEARHACAEGLALVTERGRARSSVAERLRERLGTVEFL
ncbi:MAG TPA: protein kinase, partial [Phycisphaerae bacterium]|nr:protein kinase [Phycisphaerae bacterium]